jgi:Uma2 family endonuclease
MQTLTSAITVDQYHDMISQGLLTPEDRIELLEGDLVEKMSKNPPHSFVTEATRAALERLVPSAWYARAQEPITLSESEPEPDIALIRGDRRDYVTRHPGPAEVALVVEVCDSSIERDRIIKKRIYARAAIPEYWIVDVNLRTVDVYSRPLGGEYRDHRVLAPGESLPLTIDGTAIGEVPVNSLLP